jgi:hypothetical protein
MSSRLISLGIGSPASISGLLMFGLSPAVSIDVGVMQGDLQGVAILSEALNLAAVEELVATALWTDVSDDVDLEYSPVIVDHGIHEDSPLSNLAATGVATFALDNSERNSAGLLGYYSPGHANARAGFDRGTFVRISMVTEGDVLIPQFVGRIRTIKPTAGIYRDRASLVMATDWLDEAARFPVEGLATQPDIRADQLIELLIDSMRNRPHAIELHMGTDVYPFALDLSDENRNTIQQELRRIADSERGLIYVSGDGTLVFESRYTRTLIGGSAYTLTDVLDASQERATDHVVNRVQVTVHPRRVDDDSSTVLYTSDSAVRVDHGGSPTIFLPFRDPQQEATRIGALAVVTPVPHVDYVINSADDGSALDLTTHPDITLTWDVEATGVNLTVANQTGHRAHFMSLQVRGQGLYHYDPLPLIAEDPDSIADIGVQPVELDMPYQDRVGVGQAAAQLFLHLFASTPTKVSEVPFFLFQSPEMQRLGAYGDVSTRVAYEELMAGVSADFYVNAKRMEWRTPVGGGENADVDITVWLTPADSQEYAVFDVSRFDDPTSRFAY